jgi:DNA mismatch repair protein MutS
VESASISLLWPGEPRTGAGGLEERAAVDLDLHTTVAALCGQSGKPDMVERILGVLCQDADTIRYRQEVLADLLDAQTLAGGLEELIPAISSLQRYHLPREKAELLYEVTWRLGELDSYRECVEALGGLLEAHAPHLRSRALRRLHGHVRAVREDEAFQSLQAELPGLMSRVRGIASVTVGINLDRELRPKAATLLRINKKPFRGSSDTLLGRLFGGRRAGEWEGIAPLHTMPGAGAGEALRARPVMVPLFRDLSEALSRSCRPVAAALDRYVRLSSRFLTEIGEELGFYLGAVGLIRRIQSWGLPMCRPQILPQAEGHCILEEAYNLNLALRFAEQGGSAQGASPRGVSAQGASAPGASSLKRRIVRNDVRIGEAGKVFVLTGPNRGGKTTYMQAVALAQILAQAGLYVPARSARISPVDGIFTHFPAREHPELDTGRLGEEARRLRELFSRATPRSLVLLNESLSATSPAESLLLARDVVRILRLLGAGAIYTTHMHELAAEAEQLNAESPGSARIASLISLVEDGSRRTFRIEPGAPTGYSYAGQIAAEHGVSYDQLERLLRKRGVVP